MPDGTLGMTYDDLRQAAAIELRYAHYPDLNPDEEAVLSRVLGIALRRAYYPGHVKLPDGRVVNNVVWSWMRDPTTTLGLWPTQSPASGYTVAVAGQHVTAGGSSAFHDSMRGKTLAAYTNDSSETASGSGTVKTVLSSTLLILEDGDTISDGTYRWGMTADGDYRLPTTFGGISGRITLDSQTQSGMDMVSEGRVRQERSALPSSGAPRIAAVRAVLRGGQAETEFALSVYPTPDQLYTASIPTILHGHALTRTLLHHAGGMPYSEVFRTAVLAAVESHMNDGGSRLREDEYQAALAAASYHDSNLFATHVSPHERGGWRRRHDSNGLIVTHS